MRLDQNRWIKRNVSRPNKARKFNPTDELRLGKVEQLLNRSNILELGCSAMLARGACHTEIEEVHSVLTECLDLRKRANILRDNIGKGMK